MHSGWTTSNRDCCLTSRAVVAGSNKGLSFESGFGHRSHASRRSRRSDPARRLGIDTTVPYTLLFESGLDQHFLRFPRAALALPERSLREISAVALGPGNPIAALASTYISQLAVIPGLRSGRHAEAVAEPSIELLRAVISTQLADSDLARASWEATLNLRIMQYIRAHLRDRDLSAARIAAEHNISVRRLYTLLSHSGISLGDWIRSHRLEGYRQELASPKAGSWTIAAIGRSWGFVDATHFSKVFKQAYGISPRAWRDLNRT